MELKKELAKKAEAAEAAKSAELADEELDKVAGGGESEEEHAKRKADRLQTAFKEHLKH